MTCCNPVPVLTISTIQVDSGDTTATFTTSQPLPTSGCFNLRLAGCNCVQITPCSKAQVIITDGTTSYKTVTARCGNYLQLGQVGKHFKRFCLLHFNVTVNPAGNLACLDKLCPPNVAAPVTGGTSVVTAAAATAAATAAKASF